MSRISRHQVLLLAIGLVCTAALGSINQACAQFLPNSKHSDPTDRFFQIESWLPTPNGTRTASGAPGPEYWQQRADYDIDIAIDDENQILSGTSRITYHNHSPHTLTYLWIQLDQNLFHPESDKNKTQTAPSFGGTVPFGTIKTLMAQQTFDGGYKIKAVTDGDGKSMDHSIVKTMMRIALPQPLKPGASTKVQIEYSFKVVDAKLIRARGGCEFFEDDKNFIYEIAQWFPRVVAYTDYAGWQHKQFLGRGEFTLDLGDYVVRITAPADMIVTATGELQNEKDVLEDAWIERLKKARTSKKPIFVIEPEEAKKNEPKRSKETKTWVFEAKNVRDFAFAASRKFIWDAMGVKVGDQTVMAMSFFPNEAEPLWSKYSTEAIVHTLEVYGRYSFEYPYPVAISVNGPVYGMEYPMICFNGPRPEKDGTYSKATKYGLISVVIHEVGHNFFPMIVNSDERQWTWMDEGLNTFLQYLAEQEWEENYPSRRGEPEKIVPYMRGGNQRPIMTGSEEILQFGDNAYGKPATALNILRETILGREQFDFAFKQYAQRWKFKRPTPSDFFRTMEDASGTDLDWFWRGWFFSTDHVDIGIDSVRWYKIDSGDPDERAERKRKTKAERPDSITKERNADLPKRIEWQPGLKDFFNSEDYDPDKVEESDRKAYQRFLDGLDDSQRQMLKRTTNFYIVRFRNHGGLVMPIIFEVDYADNSSETIHIPAEIWRRNSSEVDKLIVTDKEIVSLQLDPRRQTADVEPNNNHWPPRLVPSRFKLHKSGKGRNEMQRDKEKKDRQRKEQEKKAQEAKKEKDKKAETDAKADPKKKPEEKETPEEKDSKKPAKATDDKPDAADKAGKKDETDKKDAPAKKNVSKQDDAGKPKDTAKKRDKGLKLNAPLESAAEAAE